MQLSTLTDVDECPRSNVTGSRGSFQTPETTKPSHFCEGFVLYGAAPDERLFAVRPRFWRDWNLVDFSTYLKGYL